MCDAVEITIDVVFSIASIAAAIYACAHVARVENWSTYLVGPGENYSSAHQAERLQRVGEYLIIAGYFQYILALTIVVIVLRRWKAYNSMLVLAIVSLFVAFCTGVTSLVLVSAGTDRLNSDISDLMRDSIRLGNSTSDLEVNNSTGEIVEESKPTGVAWNQLQFELKCCGVNGYTDYSNDSIASSWTRRSPVALAPLTCCRRVSDSKYPGLVSNYPTSCLERGSDRSGYYSQGCLSVARASLEKTKTAVVVLCCLVLCLVLLSNIFRCIRHCRER